MITPRSLSGAELSFELTGVVSPPFGTTSVTAFGIPVAVGSPVSVRFVYDPQTMASHTGFGCDCLGYEQIHINGFFLQLGSVLVAADSYLIQVANNIQFGMQPPLDTISLIYDSRLDPSLKAGFRVDGTPQSSGAFSVTLPADFTLVDSAELPPELLPCSFGFPAMFNIIDNEPDGSPDLVFRIDSMAIRNVLGSDHDLDGDVDGRDLLIWQRHYGQVSRDGDADYDHDVDQLDLADWQGHYGQHSSLRAINAYVPEPSSPSLLLFPILLPAWRRSRRCIPPLFK